MKIERTILTVAYRCWNWDHWDEINHPDPGLRRPNEGPSSQIVVAAGTWDTGAADPRIEEALAALDPAVSAWVGHAERIGHRLRTSDEVAAIAEEGGFASPDMLFLVGEGFEVIRDEKAGADPSQWC